jgi:hypothetical protein
MQCRHCQQERANRPRGLCARCYHQPELRERYVSLSKFARRGPGNFNGQPPLPPFPTTALPGTPEKLAVLQARAGSHQCLWHPDDATVISFFEMIRAG